MKTVPSAVAAGLCALLVATGAPAVQRTFVSGLGSDLNNCSHAQPCRSFSMAMNSTDPGGEIVAIDSAGYGTISIAKSISIIAPPGVYAGITAFVDYGVSIADPGITVRLEGLTINGEGGTTGINFLNGARLYVDRCTVTNMAGDAVTAAAVGGETIVTDSTLRRNGGYGLRVQPPTAGGHVAIVDRSRLEDNTVGIRVTTGGSLVLRDSVLARNAAEGIYATTGPQGDTRVTIARTTISANGGAGIHATAPDGTKIRLSVVASELAGNGLGGIEAIAFNIATSAVELDLSGNTIVGSIAGHGVYLDASSGAAVTATASGNTISGHQHGMYATGSGASVTAARNVVARNAGYGFRQIAGALFRSTGDNVIEYSGLAATSGTITPTGPGY
jgi:hypothetical protein